MPTTAGLNPDVTRWIASASIGELTSVIVGHKQLNRSQLAELAVQELTRDTPSPARARICAHLGLAVDPAAPVLEEDSDWDEDDELADAS